MGQLRIGNTWRCGPHVNHRHALCPGPAVEIRRIGARAPRLTSGRSSRVSGFFSMRVGQNNSPYRRKPLWSQA